MPITLSTDPGIVSRTAAVTPEDDAPDFSDMTVAAMDRFHGGLPAPIASWADMKKAEKQAALAALFAESQPSADEHEDVARDLEDHAPEGTKRVRIDGAMSDPVPLYVHGVGQWKLRLGEAYTLPAEALPVLDEAGVTWKEMTK